jgi:hypothetical protein
VPAAYLGAFEMLYAFPALPEKRWGFSTLSETLSAVPSLSETLSAAPSPSEALSAAPSPSEALSAAPSLSETPSPVPSLSEVPFAAPSLPKIISGFLGFRGLPLWFPARQTLFWFPVPKKMPLCEMSSETLSDFFETPHMLSVPFVPTAALCFPTASCAAHNQPDKGFSLY